jgi:hypothetical protein
MGLMLKERSRHLFKQILIGSILLSIALNSSGQDSLDYKHVRNLIHFDCATILITGTYAVNYERAIYLSNHFKMYVNTGVGSWYLLGEALQKYSGYSVPMSLNGLVGAGNNHFEINIGVRYTFFDEYSEKERSPFFPLFNLGYRYQKLNGRGLTFRSYIGFSGIGIGVGKAF